MKRTLRSFAVPKHLAHIIAALLVFTSMPSLANDEIDTLINQLESGDDEVIPLLLEQKDVVLKRILARRPSVDEIKAELAKLGHETHAVRKAASNALMTMGPAIHATVREHLKTSTDPEVIVRCRELLKALPELEKKKAARQRVEFLIHIPDLPADVVKQFAFGYTAYFDTLEFDEDKKPDTYLTNFLYQYAAVPGSAATLCKRALTSKQYYTFEAFSDAAFRADKHVAIRQFLTNNEFLGVALEILACDYADAFTKKEWMDIVDRLLLITKKEITYGEPKIFQNLAPNFAPHALRLLSSEHLPWQAFGLASYRGDWKAIRPQLRSMFDRAETSQNREFEEVLKFIEPPASEMPWFLEQLLGTRKMRLSEEYVRRLAKMTDPLPVDAILGRIGHPGKDSERSVWCDALLELRPDLKESIVKRLLVAAEKATDGYEFDRIRNYLEYSLKQTFEVGQFDGKWSQFIEKQQRWEGEAMRFIRNWRISPALVLATLKAVNDSPDMRFYSGPDIVYLCMEASGKNGDEVLDYVMGRTMRGEEPFTHSAVLLALSKRRPDETVTLLRKKADWFYEKDRLGTTLRYCMLGEGGSHGDTYADVNTFVLAVRDPLMEKLRKLSPDDPDFQKWFPYVCILSLDRTSRSKHGKLLSELLQRMIPGIGHSGHVIGAFIAGVTLKIKPSAIQHLLLRLVDAPPRHYNDEIVYLLNPTYSDAIPALLRKQRKSQDLYPLKVALMISPKDPSVLDELTKRIKESTNRKTVAEAAELLGMVDAIPPASSFDAKRLRWMESHVFDRTEDKLIHLRALMPHIREEARSEEWYDGPDNLIQDDPKCQQLILPLLLDMLKSSHRYERQAAASMLWYCSDQLKPHMPFIHERFKKETDSMAIRSLLHAVSRLGREASFMTDTVKGLTVENSEPQWTCLAKTSPDVNDRKHYLLELMKNRNNMWSIRQIKDQPEVTKPYWRERLKSALTPGIKGADGVDEDRADQIAWYLSERPSEESLADLKSVLIAAAAHPRDISEDLVSATLWALMTDYPKRLEQLKTAIADLPTKYKMKSSYWQVSRKLRRPDTDK